MRLKELAISIDDPFPVRVYDKVLDNWGPLATRFPSDDLLFPLETVGHKNRLSASESPEAFRAFLSKDPEWATTVMEIRTEFPALCRYVFPDLPEVRTTVRFEFSGLPEDGGCILPHPDRTCKLVTMVLHFNEHWDNMWGGQFEVLRHLTRPNDDFSDYNRPRWDEVETVLAVEVMGNRAIFMRRTPNSLHGVRSIKSLVTRRSITVNLIETTK